MKIFNRGNITYFVIPIIIVIFIFIASAFTLFFSKANASQNIKNIKINSDFELVDQLLP